MARSGIRYEEVKEVAETLLTHGLNPTIQRVREQLGTGSNTTISEHLKRWQQQMAETPRAVLPPTVPEAVTHAMETFWKIAVQYAETAFEEQRIITLRTVTAAEQARDAALTQSQQIQAEAAEIQRQWEIAQAAQHDLANRLLIEQERRAAAETAIQAAEERVQAAIISVNQMRAETDARIAQMDVMLQQAYADLERQRLEARRQLEYERERNAANEVKLTQLLDQERAERAAEQQAFSVERQNRLHQLENAQREYAELQRNLAHNRERLEQSTATLDTLHATLEQREVRIQEAEHTLEIMRVRLEVETNLRLRLEKETVELHELFKGIISQPEHTKYFELKE